MNKGLITAFAIALTETAIVGYEKDMPLVSAYQTYQIRRRKVIRDVLPVICYPSDRKSKGEKKREKSAKHKRGWK